MKSPDNAWSYLQKQAQFTPDKAAIIDEQDRVATFEQFLSDCNRAAARLSREGIDSTSRVALNTGPSRDCLITALALIRCGAVMVPIDIRFPKLAVEQMVESAKCTHIVTNQAAPDGIKVVPLDFSALACDESPPEPTPRELAQEGLILFTSGSTGEPKGVSITSGFFLERFTDHNRDQAKKVISLFKGSITWICVIPVVELCRGDTVLIMPYDTLIDPEAFLQRLLQYEVTEFGTVPSHLRLLTTYPDLLRQMKRVYVWGEFITDDLIETMRSSYSEVELFDIYSATESLGYGAIRRLSGTDYDFASGWRADHGYGMHVLNEQNEAAGIGQRGEIAFSGDALASGYIHDPELGASKFFDNPFGEGRLYRTGDIGTQMADGTITLHGREDAQVQIRGIRVELAEIESCAAQYPGVTGAAAFVITDDDDVLSIGLYVTPTSIDIPALRTHLSGRLSEYAIPSFVAGLDELPRTSSGKVNRKNLRRGLVPSAPAAAQDDTEARVVAIFSELLGASPVQPDDDFYELGGHSLLLAKLITKVNAELHVGLSPLEAAQNASPRKLSVLVNHRREERGTQESAIEIPAELPLPKEAVLWFGYKDEMPADVEEWKRDMYITEYLGGHITYAFVEIPDCIDSQEKLERTLTHLFHRHPILTSRVPEEKPPARLLIAPFSLDDYLVNDYGGRLEEAERMQVYRELTDFFEVPLVKIYVHDGKLHFAFHHILSDHASMNIVKRDFVDIAEALARGTTIPGALDYSLIAKCLAYENNVGEERYAAPPWILPSEILKPGKQPTMGYRIEIPPEILRELNDGDLLPFSIAAVVSALHDTTGQVEGNLYMVLDFRSLKIMPYNMTNHIGYLSFIKPVYFSYHGPKLTRLDNVLQHYREAMRKEKNELPPHQSGDGVVFNYMESDGPPNTPFEDFARVYRIETNPLCTVYDWGQWHVWKGVWIDITHYTDDHRLNIDVYASSSGYSKEAMVSFCALFKQHLSRERMIGRAHADRTDGTLGRVRAIFSELLDVPAVGADDDFFEMGGHSLLLWKLVTALNTVFPAKVSPSDAARLSTPRKLAEFVRNFRTAESLRPATVAVPSEIPLAEEARTWFGHSLPLPEDGEKIRQLIYTTRLLGGHVIYKSFHMPETIKSQKRLEQVLTHLFSRHPILCARIPHEQSPRQMHLVPFCLADYQVNTYGEAPAQDTTVDVYRHLSLFYDVPLVKIHSDGKTIHFALHHILSDQSSLRIIKKDFLDIARALENKQPLPPALDYNIIEKYLPPGEETTADLEPWRLDRDQDDALSDRWLFYRLDFPAASVQHILPRDLPCHAVCAIISAIHDITGQTEGDLFMVVDQRGQYSTLDNIIDHIGYLSFIRPVRIPHHGPHEMDRTKIMDHYRRALREGKSETRADAEIYRVVLNYVEDDERLHSPLQELATYQTHQDEVCAVCDFGDSLRLKVAYINFTHHTRERSLHVDIYTSDRRYGQQCMVQFCHQLHQHFTASQSEPHVPPAH